MCGEIGTRRNQTYLHLSHLSADCPPSKKDIQEPDQTCIDLDLSAPVGTCPHLSSNSPPSKKDTQEPDQTRREPDLSAPVRTCPPIVSQLLSWSTLGVQVQVRTGADRTNKEILQKTGAKNVFFTVFYAHLYPSGLIRPHPNRHRVNPPKRHFS